MIHAALKPKAEMLISLLKDHGIENAEHFFNSRLQPILEQQESQRFQLLMLLKKRIQIGILVLLMAMLLLLGVYGAYYVPLAELFESMQISYYEWYLVLPSSLKFFLPSRLIVWSLPSPYLLFLLVSVLTLLWVFIPYFNFTKEPSLHLFEEIVAAQGYQRASHNEFHSEWILGAPLWPVFNGYNLVKLAKKERENQTIWLAEIQLILTLKEKIRFGFWDASERITVFNGVITIMPAKETSTSVLLVKHQGIKTFNRKKLEQLSQVELPASVSEKAALYTPDLPQTPVWVTETVIKELEQLSKFSEQMQEHIQPSSQPLWSRMLHISATVKQPFYQGQILNQAVSCITADERLLIVTPCRHTLLALPSLWHSAVPLADIGLLSTQMFIAERLFNTLQASSKQ